MIGCLALDLIYTFFIFKIAHFFEIDIPSVSGGEIPIFTFSFPFMLIGAAFTEEVLFRLIPLAIAIDKGWSIAGLLAVAFVFSAIFGILHGSAYHIFIQGAGGFMYSVLFLKCGGLQRNYIKAVAATTITHFLFNAVVVGIAVAGGATSI